MKRVVLVLADFVGFGGLSGSVVVYVNVRSLLSLIAGISRIV
jgi:hypothetical protein